MTPIFSYFNYRTRLDSRHADISDPLIRFQLENSDQEAGRFWFGLLHAFRASFPDIGNQVLDGLVDFHHLPIAKTLVQLTGDLEQKKWKLILENSQIVSSTNWWADFLAWIQPFKKSHMIELRADVEGKTRFEAIEMIRTIPATQRIMLASSNVWWIAWFNEKFPSENWVETWEKLRVANYLSVISQDVILPKEYFLDLLRGQINEDAFSQIQSQQSQLADWLQDHGEWLESVRIRISTKDFEEAGNLLEKYAQIWLTNATDPLEILFWLKEIPGVLMNYRPVLCLLAAQAAQQIRLNLQTSYYLNALENNLFSLRRLCKSDEEWHKMKLNDQGMTTQSMLEKIQLLRMGEQ